MQDFSINSIMEHFNIQGSLFKKNNPALFWRKLCFKIIEPSFVTNATYKIRKSFSLSLNIGRVRFVEYIYHPIQSANKNNYTLPWTMFLNLPCEILHLWPLWLKTSDLQ